jgi:peptide/nickel transport system substrate-binding protein
MRKLLLATAMSCAFAPIALARGLVVAVGGEPEAGFDPIQGWGDYGHPLFQASLLKLDADLNIVGDLATEWALSDDRLTWTLSLRDDAKFSDGTALTAEDVAFTFNTARDAGGLADLSNLKEARATGPLTVELELNTPKITFIRRLTTMGIVPKASYGKGYARAPIGAGPFKMVEWREGETLIVEPNPHWYGGDIAFDRISFVFGEEDAVVAMARAGAAQLVSVPPQQADDVPAGMQMVAVETVDNRGMMFPMVPDTGEKTEEGYPIGNNVTSDLAIRRAINQGLDRDALVALALNGHGKPATGPVDGLPWNNPDAAIAGNDMAGAKATLDAAGWVDGDGDGIREKGGVPAAFDMIYPASDSTRQALALGVSEQMQALGIAVTPVGKSWDEIETLMHANVIVFGWGAHDPSEIFNLYDGSRRGVEYFNTGYYNNDAVNAHFAKAEAAPNFEASLADWQAAQWDGTTGFGSKGDAAWAWMVNLEHNYFVSECLDIGPMQVHPHGHGFPITHGIADWKWTCE